MTNDKNNEGFSASLGGRRVKALVTLFSEIEKRKNTDVERGFDADRKNLKYSSVRRDKASGLGLNLDSTDSDSQMESIKTKVLNTAGRDSGYIVNIHRNSNRWSKKVQGEGEPGKKIHESCSIFEIQNRKEYCEEDLKVKSSFLLKNDAKVCENIFCSDNCQCGNCRSSANSTNKGREGDLKPVHKNSVSSIKRKSSKIWKNLKFTGRMESLINGTKILDPEKGTTVHFPLKDRNKGIFEVSREKEDFAKEERTPEGGEGVGSTDEPLKELKNKTSKFPCRRKAPIKESKCLGGGRDVTDSLDEEVSEREKEPLKSSESKWKGAEGGKNQEEERNNTPVEKPDEVIEKAPLKCTGGKENLEKDDGSPRTEKEGCANLLEEEESLVKEEEMRDLEISLSNLEKNIRDLKKRTSDLEVSLAPLLSKH